jgi:hypothetical protein
MVRYLTLLLFLGTAQAQSIYCSLENNTSAKVTLSNLATYSQDFADASWTKTRTTISSNALIAPDGTLTADTLVGTATTNSFLIGKAITGSPASGEARRTSVYLKRGTDNFAVLVDDEAVGADHALRLNINTCTVVDSTNVSRWSTLMVGNGWCNVVMEYTVLTTGAITNYITLWDGVAAGLYPSFAATTADTINIWGIQSNLVSSPVDYLATTASAATLGPICASMQAQSPLDPTRCMAMTNRGREIRTEAQIAIGSQ